MISFQECPRCGGLVGASDYAELRLPVRTAHLLHCDYCSVGYLLSVYPDGRPVMIECRPPSKSYKVFLAALRDLHEMTTTAAMNAALAA